MKDQDFLYNRLVEVACTGKTISYSDVAALLECDIHCPADRSEITRMLNEIAYQENANGRPLLSAVVVIPEIGYPGRGFFILARELGFNHFEDERSYYGYELKQVHKYWQKQLTAAQTVPYMTVDQHEIRVAIG
jgi:hypothetical protein